jgi:dUTP pyrophosphatase
MSVDSIIHTRYIDLKYRHDSTVSDFAILKLSVQNDELLELYKTKVEKHNKSFIENVFADSGFDLFVPDDVTFDKRFASTFIDMQVKAELINCDFKTDNLTTVPYYLYPRSSISKTPLMLANHTGVIDSGYRGNLIGAFRSFEENYIVTKHTRLIQLCHTNLLPIYVILVKDEDLSTSERGAGGFGSTGK